jgi:hypothetical protein
MNTAYRRVFRSLSRVRRRSANFHPPYPSPLTTHALLPTVACCLMPRAYSRCPLPADCCLFVNRGASIRNHTRELKRGIKNNSHRTRLCPLDLPASGGDPTPRSCAGSWTTPNIQPSRYRIPISLFTSFSIVVSATCEIGMVLSNFARCNPILIVSRRTSSLMVPSLLYADQ